MNLENEIKKIDVVDTKEVIKEIKNIEEEKTNRFQEILDIIKNDSSASIRGYLNPKEIIHISFITLTWLITSGYFLYFINLLPIWAQPLVTVSITLIIGTWKVLRALENGL